MAVTLREFVADYFDAALDLAADYISPADVFNDDINDPKPTSTVPWMDTAQSHLGLKEIPGRRHEAQIMRWADAVGGWVKDYYTKDEIPWCGLFIAGCFMANDIKIVIKNPLSALAYRKQGFHTDPQFGAVMCFTRKGGGHVGFYVSEEDKYFHILGGNQSNKVSVTKISKRRFKEARWPSEYKHLHKQFSGRIYKKFDGKVSYNEA